MRGTKISLDDYDYRQIKNLAGLNPSHNFRLHIVQQPENGRGVKWPIEPPPVLELTSPEKDAQKWLYIHNPNWFCVADLLTIEVYPSKAKANAKKDKDIPKDNLSGLLASSLHKVKSPEDRTEHGYFVFGDLNVRDAGRYKIEFTLFEMRQYKDQLYAAKVDSTTSHEFDIQNSKPTPITKDSTKLSKVLSESGVKLRLRKESSKRKQSTFNWSATPGENLHYGAHRAHANMAPTHGPQMPPPSNPNARFSRNSGEDISRRLSVIHTEMGSTSFASQPGLMNAINVMNQPGNLHNPVGQAPSSHYDYNMQHTLSPMSRLPAQFPSTTREMSTYPGQVSLQAMQQTSQQPWNFPGQGSFRPEAHQDHHHQLYSGQRLPDPRIDFERGDSGYSSHGRPSLTHMESGAMDAYHARSSPYGQTSMPAMPLPQAEPMQPQEWNMDANLPNFTGYDTMDQGRQRGMGAEQEAPYTFSAGNGPVYSYSLQHPPGPN